MTLEYLRYFIAVYESGSIQGASRQLFVSAQGIGQGIRRLEESIGVTLLVRTPAGVRPTAFGQKFYQRAKGVDEQLRGLEELVREHNARQKVHLTVGTLGHSKFLSGINACAEQYARQNPELMIRVSSRVARTGAELLELLRGGEIDVSCLFHWQEHSDLRYLPVSGYSELTLLTRKGNPIVRDGAVQWPLLAGQGLIIAEEDDPFADVVRRLCSDNGFAPNFSIYSTENTFIARLVDAGTASIILRKAYLGAIMRSCSNTEAVPLLPEVRVAYSLILRKTGYSREQNRFVRFMQSFFSDVMGLGVAY